MVKARTPLPSSSAGVRHASLFRGRLEPFIIKAGIGAQVTGRREVCDQQVDRSVTLGLNDQLAFEFERCAEQHRQRDGFGKQTVQPAPGRRAGPEWCRSSGQAGLSRPRTSRPSTSNGSTLSSPAKSGSPRVLDFGFHVQFPTVCRAQGTFDLAALVRAKAGRSEFSSRPCRHSPGDPPEPRQRASIEAPMHQRMIAFCACKRFSASSKTTDCGPSITSLVTSSPRWAGRQCMNSASLLAFAHQDVH
jgi:hypothetical protein